MNALSFYSKFTVLKIYYPGNEANESDYSVKIELEEGEFYVLLY